MKIHDTSCEFIHPEILFMYITKEKRITILDFSSLHIKYHKMIHHLLRQYRITYNYDEFYQLLLIKLWEISKIYNPSSSVSLSSFYLSAIKVLSY